MENDIKVDVVIAGVGVAGLFTAIHLPMDTKVLMICKEDMESCDSMLAQGGICVLRDADDYDAFFEDTMRAGHYENRKESVDIMIRSSRDIIDQLLDFGVRFNKNEDGSLMYTREGAHSKPRICFHDDITGKEITETLQRYVKTLPNVEIMEYTVMEDIMVENGTCTGLTAKDSEGNTLHIYAKDTVLATGGIGGLYEQIHPTSLYTEHEGRSFLISESARGEGAILLNSKGQRFTDELQPRDIVSKAIHAEMEKEGSKHVWLSFEHVPQDVILHHFTNIYQTCLEEGYDITKEPIPVVPAQHYFMGGIHVDADSCTTMKHLYAVGETSCNGVHGKNRLASNSLLESLVFGQRAAEKICREDLK